MSPVRADLASSVVLLLFAAKPFIAFTTPYRCAAIFSRECRMWWAQQTAPIQLAADDWSL